MRRSLAIVRSRAAAVRSRRMRSTSSVSCWTRSRPARVGDDPPEAALPAPLLGGGRQLGRSEEVRGERDRPLGACLVGGRVRRRHAPDARRAGRGGAHPSRTSGRYGRRVLRRLAIPAALVGLLALAACGDVTGAGSGTSTPASAPASILPDVSLVSTSTVPPTTIPHPSVSVPATTPTKLTTTVLKPGSGTASKAGDAVVVNYVGARSADGTEFDNNYGQTPLMVSPVGSAQMIEGFNQGLIGVQPGEQLQLDIPSDLAYGDAPQGDVIKAGDALSFVIDVLAVLPATTQADEPAVTVAGAPNRADLATKDLVVGTGPAVTTGTNIAIEIVAYRGDTGERVFSTWAESAPVVFDYGVDSILPGLEQGIAGMNVGGRRQITIPYALGFGEAGNSQLGVPGSTDLVLVVDVIAAF